MSRRTMVARDPFSGTEGAVFDFTEVMSELHIQNDGTAPLVFTTCQVGRGVREREVFKHTLGPGDVFDERLDPFTRLKVEANGPYQGHPRFWYR